MKLTKILNKIFGDIPKPYALPMLGLGAQPGDYTWSDWKRENKAKYPFRYWLHETLPLWFRVHITMKIQHWWYWFRTHTISRYHILDLRSKVGIEYKWGYLDCNQAMMLACFNLLCSFVEKEDGLAGLKDEDPYWYANASQADKDMIDQQRERLLEIKSLYDWWCIGRKKEHDEVDNLYGVPYHNSLIELDKRDNEMLLLLIKHRHYLWT